MQRPHRDADEIVGVRVETLILRSEATHQHWSPVEIHRREGG